MKSVENVSLVAKHSWSVRLMVLAAMLETVSIAGPALLPDLASFLEAAMVSKISLVLIVAGIVARFIKQAKVSG